MAGKKWLTADERLVVLQQIIAASIDYKEAADLLVHYLIAAQQTLVQLQALRIALAPVDAIQKLRSRHQLVNHVLFLDIQPVHAERHGDQLELGDLGGNIFIDVFVQQALICRLGRRRSAPACLGLHDAGTSYK